jgi:outer membrane protein OmpA-like peptidoglycan-associated protein
MNVMQKEEHTMNIPGRLLTGAALALLLAACASNSTEAPDIAAARAEIQRADADPLARQVAAAPLDAAQVALQAAQKQSGAERDQSLFEASYNAQVAAAMVRTARARAEVDDAEKQRTQVLLQARENETARARRDAQAQAAQAAAANSQAAAANSQAAAATSEAEQLRQQMAALNAQQTTRGMVMTLQDVLFDTGRATLNPGANGPLDQVAAFLKGNPRFKVRIEGHTDSIGSAEYNQTLSEQRADSVRTALSRRGVFADQMSALGKGETMPLASNRNAAGRQQNRRVEIVFSDQQGEFAGQGSTPAASSP